MKLVAAILVSAVVFVAPSMAADVDTAAFQKVTGVKLSDAEVVTLEMKNVLVAKVTNVATLPKLGLTGFGCRVPRVALL